MRFTLICSLLLGLMTLSSTAKAQEADPFAGNWAGEGVELELKAANKGYGGFCASAERSIRWKLPAMARGPFRTGRTAFP